MDLLHNMYFYTSVGTWLEQIIWGVKFFFFAHAWPPLPLVTGSCPNTPLLKIFGVQERREDRVKTTWTWMTASQLLLPQINLQQKQPQYILHSLHNSTHINTIWQIFHKDPKPDILIGCSNSAFGNNITNFMNPYQFAAKMEHEDRKSVV